MALYKTSDPAEGRALGFTYAEAKEMIRKEGFLYDGLPQQFKTSEMLDICNDYWRDHIYDVLKYYLEDHPDELAPLVRRAKAMQGMVTADADMTFDVE
jgi:hypothetical protein